jgi:hypothetical protein
VLSITIFCSWEWVSLETQIKTSKEILQLENYLETVEASILKFTEHIVQLVVHSRELEGCLQVAKKHLQIAKETIEDMHI